MNKFNKIIFSLLLSLSIPAFGMEQVKLAINTPVAKLGPLGKLGAVASVVALNQILTYISLYAHENGHGIASLDPKYKVTILYPKNLTTLLNPAAYTTLVYPTTKNHKILTLAAGPLAGIFTTCSQLAGLEILHRSIGKSPSWAGKVLNILKTGRVISVIYEAIYGFLPLNVDASVDSTGGTSGHGDGHGIWQILLNNLNCPTINNKYYLLTLATGLLGFYISSKLGLRSIE